MSRVIAVLLLLLLPLQSAFGAAAGYCKTEKPEVASHFGHHEHGDENSGMAGKTDSSSDAGCEICNLGCAQINVCIHSLKPELVTAFEVHGTIQPPPDCPPQPFERPPKQRLA